MPVYVYECRRCGEKFDSVRSMIDNDKEVKCPVCGENNPRRLISTVFGGAADLNRGNLRIPV